MGGCRDAAAEQQIKPLKKTWNLPWNSPISPLREPSSKTRMSSIL